MSVQTTLDGLLARDVVKANEIAARKALRQLKLNEKCQDSNWEFTKQRELEYCKPPPQKYTPATDLRTVAPVPSSNEFEFVCPEGLKKPS